MNLFIEYYKPRNIARHGEFLSCLYENINNKLIKHIHVFISDDSIFPFESNKVTLNLIDGVRPTFKDIFMYASTACKGQICILANADIAFDESLSVVQDVNMDKLLIAISRHDVQDDGSDVLFDNAAAQDAWIFKSPLKVDDNILNQMDFRCGSTGGPDNKFAYLMDEAGYELRNPAKQIKIRHIHSSKQRNVTSTIPGPYLCLMPNDDINKKPEYIRLKGFDGYGLPIPC